jgi:hypothetical protein
MGVTYTDNQVPIGSRVETIKRGVSAGTTVGVYVFENITLDRPSGVVERVNEIGEDNGWALVNKKPCTGSAVLQIPTSTAPIPHGGDWFSDQFDGSTAGSAEQWVLVNIGQPFEHSGYYKCNVTLRLSRTPPTS